MYPESSFVCICWAGAGEAGEEGDASKNYNKLGCDLTICVELNTTLLLLMKTLAFRGK